MASDQFAWHEVDGHPQTRWRSVDWSSELPRVQTLFREYRQWIADHSDQSPVGSHQPPEGLAALDELFGTLPGAYGPPRGDVLLWFEGSDLVACGALREQQPDVGELKRVYIRPDYRGEDFGKPFVRTMIARARELGFRRLRSYALGSMTSAIEFHQELGFRRIPAYWAHPASNTVFFERELGKDA